MGITRQDLRRAALTCSLLLAATAATAAAQGGPGGGRGMGGGGMGMMRYDDAQARTVSGTVKSVATMEMAPGMGMTRLLVATEAGDLDVPLGPKDWVDGQPTKLKEGDAVAVRGIDRETPMGTFFVAGWVAKGADTLRLRDKDGMPAFRGAMRGMRQGPGSAPPPQGQHPQH